mmetsp:Transcript_1676/g.1994  ORF Transcript_1676/g.1994 Transcript_1676/m.1994 type:complete len:1452 (-) Transcript_1676:196-4551(-)
MAKSSKRCLDSLHSIGSPSERSPIRRSRRSLDRIKLDQKVPSRRSLDQQSPSENSVNGDNDIGVRRSKRAKTSRLEMINGYSVLTANNYVLKGDTYVFGAFDADKPVSKCRKNVKKSLLLKKPKKTNAASTARMTHNAAVKECIAHDTVVRERYMEKRYKILAPFVEDKVLSEMKQNHLIESEEDTDAHPVVQQQPDSIVSLMRDYQLIGLEWMVKMHSCGMPMILGDEMGLGKTIQTISLVAHLKEHCLGGCGPSLIICPLSVLYSWCSEIEKHAPSLKYFRFHASGPKEKEAQKSHITANALSYDMIITTYEMAKSPAILNFFSRIFFNYVVLDEGHIIKDISTQISAAVRKIHSRNKLILTGTPLQNNLTELYTILNYLYPDYFIKPDNFTNAFDLGKNKIDSKTLLSANKLLNLFMLRRLKAEVEKMMPKKIETKILCPLSSTQVSLYKSYLMKDMDSIIRLSDKNDTAKTPSKLNYNLLKNLVMQLRKCSLHPYLFEGVETDIDETSAEKLISVSGKLAVLDKILLSMFKKGNRTVIFSQFTSMLNILEDYCELRDWKFCRFDGSTARAQRNYLINRFNAPNSEYFIFLMSTRSGGLGINLQSADTCILYDSDWNPQPDIQAMARVHRIGQTKTVHVYRLVSGGTVEERILERAEKKLFLDKMVNEGGGESSNNNDASSGLTASDLLETLKFGSNAVFASANELPSSVEIANITDRNRSEETSCGLLQGGTANNAKDFDATKSITDGMTFKETNFRAIRDKITKSERAKVSMPDTNSGRGKRVRTSRLVQVEGKGSGYGATYVPVLLENHYDLENGEPSVYLSETKKTIGCAEPEKKKRPKVFDINQDFCQDCGDGGTLILCPRCPISIHASCCGLKAHEFSNCSHHRCNSCMKSTADAGGLLFACEACTEAYCEDCIPEKDVTFLGMSTPRFDKLGLIPHPAKIYIHCSLECKEVSKIEFGWKEKNHRRKKYYNKIDVSYAFGDKARPYQDVPQKNSVVSADAKNLKCGRGHDDAATTVEKKTYVKNNMFKKLTDRISNFGAQSPSTNDRITTLTSMGFSESESRTAIQTCTGNVDQALEFLLSQQSLTSHSTTTLPASSAGRSSEDTDLQRALEASLKKETSTASKPVRSAASTRAGQAALSRFDTKATNSTSGRVRKPNPTSKPKSSVPSTSISIAHPNTKTPALLKNKPKEEQIQRCARRLSSHAYAVDTLHRCLSQLKTHPTNPKYRTIHKENKGFKAALENVPGAEDLLKAVNFKAIRTSGRQELVLQERDLDMALLWMAVASLETTQQTPEYKSAKQKTEFAKIVKGVHTGSVLPATLSMEDELIQRANCMAQCPSEPPEGRGALLHLNMGYDDVTVSRRFDADDQLRDVMHWIGSHGSVIPEKLTSGEWLLVDVNKYPVIPVADFGDLDTRGGLDRTLQVLGCWPSGRLELRPKELNT